jgi:galactokinase
VIALNRLFNLKLSPIEMIQIAMWSEHHFVGVKCGIMDQFASMMGKKDHVLQLDCKTLEYTYHPLQLNNYVMLLCDTNVKHTLASSEYNTRREECDRGVSLLRKTYPRITSLRDVKPEMLDACKGTMPRVIFNRCRYVVEENTRVIDAAKDLRRGDLKSFGEKMYKTHDGLSKLYEVSCAELDFLVGLTRSYPGIAGSRMMGGGFSGCTLNLIEHSALENFMTDARAVYKEKFNLPLNFHVVRTGKGANVTENIRQLEL